MKKYLKLLGFSSCAFFILGLGWGIWNHKKNIQQLAKAAPLRILCAENWISNSALEVFSREHNVRIEQWTYATPSEFLRQMANSEAKVDVICTSSLLVRSLVHSHWLKKLSFQSLPNAKLLAVDFARLPYDPDSEYSVPLFWNLYGFFGKGEVPQAISWKQTLQSKKISVWGEELNLLQLMSRFGMNVEQLLQEEDSKSAKSVDEEVHHFSKSVVHILKPEVAALSAEALMENSDWVQLPLARVARLLGENSPYHFWLPDDGAMIELGVLAVGEKSSQPDLALALINELISTDQALQTHLRLDSGVVHASLSSLTSIVPLQKPQALRQFALNRLKFPDLNVEVLPRFQKIFDETLLPQH